MAAATAESQSQSQPRARASEKNSMMKLDNLDHTFVDKINIKFNNIPKVIK
jgi:hypothetical protein